MAVAFCCWQRLWLLVVVVATFALCSVHSADLAGLSCSRTVGGVQGSGVVSGAQGSAFLLDPVGNLVFVSERRATGRHPGRHSSHHPGRSLGELLRDFQQHLLAPRTFPYLRKGGSLEEQFLSSVELSGEGSIAPYISALLRAWP